MSVLDNLNRIKSCKEDIKQAIIDKGVDMTDVAFTEYATKISEIPQGGGGGTADIIEATQNLSPNYYSTAVRVPDYTFAYCPTITSVDLPNVWEVGNTAFYYCLNLNNVNLPSCERISAYAFQDCRALTAINLPNCSYISEGIFFNCSALQYANMQNCSVVAYKTFENCINLSDVVLTNCTRIDNQAFSSCNALPYLDLPNCTRIETNAFRKCSNLTQVNIPRCSYLSTNVFNSCLNLTQVDLTNTYYCQLANSNAFLRCPFSRGEGSIYIHAGQLSLYQNGDFWSWYSACFVPIGDPNQTLLGFDGSRLYGDTSVIYNDYENAFHITRDMITSVDLPNLVNIESSCFNNCYNLTDVNLPNCVSLALGAFENCTALTSINLPNCEYLQNYAFGGCSNLTSINLPNCTNVRAHVFRDCATLTSINLPMCEYVGVYAFANCPSLTTINLPNCSQIGYNLFEGDYANDYPSKTLYVGTSISTVCRLGGLFDNAQIGKISAIYVPMSLVESYKTAEVWGAYASLIFGV